MRRSRSAGGPKQVRPKHILYGLFILGNVIWFFWTLLFVGSDNSPSKSEEGNYDARSQIRDPWAQADDFPFGEPLSVRKARLEGKPVPSITKSRKEALGGPSKLGTSSSQSSEEDNLNEGSTLSKTFQEATVTGSLHAGSLKISGNVLSSMAGKLLISANSIGIGTSTMDVADKLVVNGPIRIADGGTRPQCNSIHRGMIWHEFGELGVGDSLDTCVKNRFDDYEWVALVRGGGGGTQKGVNPLGGRGAGGAVSGGSSGDSGDTLLRTFIVANGGQGVGAGDVVSFVEGRVQRGFGLQTATRYKFMDPASDTQASGSQGQHKRRLHLLALSTSRMVLLYGGGLESRALAQLGFVNSPSEMWLEKRRVEFGPRRLDHFHAATLTESSFVVGFADPTQHEQGMVVVGRVEEESVLTFEVPVPFLGKTGVVGVAVCALAPTRFALAFNTKSGGGHGPPMIVIGSISDEEGSVIFSKAIEAGVHLDGFSLVSLGTDRFAMVYRNLRTKAAGIRLATVLVPSEDDLDECEITLGSDLAIKTAGRVLTYLQATAMTPSRIAVAYADGVEGNLVLVDVSAGILSAGPPSKFANGKPLSVSLAKLDSHKLVLTFYSSNPWKAVVMKGEMPEDSAEFVFTEHLLSEHYSTHTTIGTFGSQTFAVAFYDGGDQDAGMIVAGSLGTGLGVAAASATEGEQVPVLFSGVSQGHMGLAVGSCYYALGDGSLTTARTTHRVGLAISVSELLVGSQGC